MSIHIVLAFALALWASSADAESDRAEYWFERANAALLSSYPLEASATITTQRNGSVETLRMEYARDWKDGEKQTKIWVHPPRPGAGRIYKMKMREGEPLRKWVWIPPLRRVLQADDARRLLPFYDTQFVYEDLAVVFPHERRRGTAQREQRGESEAVRLESEAYLGYGRVVAWLDPESALPREIEFYDLDGALLRSQRWDAFQAVGDGRFPTRIIARNHQTGEVSTLRFAFSESSETIPREGSAAAS